MQVFSSYGSNPYLNNHLQGIQFGRHRNKSDDTTAQIPKVKAPVKGGQQPPIRPGESLEAYARRVGLKKR